MGDINKAVSFMINTAKDNIHGYDQQHRNGPDYDCSSLVGTALYYAGFDVSPYSWTGNLESQLRKAGFVDCKAPWKAGDIHLNRGNHVCMSINESQIVEASINEKGTAYWHTGSNPGFRCFFITYPESKETLVAFMNTDEGFPAMKKLMQLFLDNNQTFWAYDWREAELD